MQDLPFVSIIVPVYNGEKIIGECIESLLNQTYPKDKYEISIIDNNSKDRTPDIIKKYPVRYLLENKIQSSYAARNKGVKQSSGDIIAFTDADCIATPEWLQEGIKGFSKEIIGCVAGGIEGYAPSNYIEEFLIKRGCFSNAQTLRDPWFLPFAPTANVFYKKDVFNKIGLFEERWRSGGDADLAWRMQLETNFKMQVIPEASVYHKHRSTLRSFFNQRRTWGYGSILLYKKYKKMLPYKPRKTKVKEVYWELVKMWRLFVQLTRKYFASIDCKYEFLQVVADIGFNLGIIEAKWSEKNK